MASNERSHSHYDVEVDVREVYFSINTVKVQRYYVREVPDGQDDVILILRVEGDPSDVVPAREQQEV